MDLRYPTDPFAILDSKNPPINGSGQHKIPRFPDLAAQLRAPFQSVSVCACGRIL